MLISITDFARERGEQSQTVAKWIREHGFPTVNQGKKKMIDTSAAWYQELDSKYPLPKPTIIMNGVPEEEHRAALERLTKAQEAIIMLQNELTDIKMLNAENEAHKMLLEDKQKRSETDLQEARDMVSQLKAELEQERSKTWWDKLRRK